VALRVEDIDLAADRELVERWQAGEHAAFDDLYRRYFSRLRSFCQRRVGDRDTAEEIAQEAFVKALQALPRFAGERRFYPWVTVIAGRLCVDHHRRLGRVQPVEEVDPGTVDGDHGERLAFLADVDNLDRALERLGPRHLEVLDLRERKGMSYAQIAEHLAVPQSTVEALLFRARKALRREFMAVCGEGGKLATLPVIGIVVRRLTAMRDRVAEALPSLSHLAGPITAGAMAAAVSIAPFSGAPSISTAAAGPRLPLPAVHVATTSAPTAALPPPAVVTPPAAETPVPPASTAPLVEPMTARDAQQAGNDMPVVVDSGPAGAALDPTAVPTWLDDNLMFVLEARR